MKEPFRVTAVKGHEISTYRLTSGRYMTVWYDADGQRQRRSRATLKEADELTKSYSAEEPEVGVFVKGKDNKVTWLPGKTGIQDINYIEVTGGLKGGEEVVTGPYDAVSKVLKKGTQVKVVDKKELFEKKD